MININWMKMFTGSIWFFPKIPLFLSFMVHTNSTKQHFFKKELGIITLCLFVLCTF